MSEATGPLARRRILVVEDEYLIAESIERWLIMAGAEVLGPVPSVRQAFEIIGHRGTRLDAPVLHGAVLDINLGRGETVYPVADRLNELGVPYLFATGDVRVIDDPLHRERVRLSKPVSHDDLLRALLQLVEKDS